ncbi:MAG: hypothetical protein M1838_001008 [Thelocarpon superellum]|nr:MAG: hypothetical protein M1838_001008 [Thelocarpon superellum]
MATAEPTVTTVGDNPADSSDLDMDDTMVALHASVPRLGDGFAEDPTRSASSMDDLVEEVVESPTSATSPAQPGKRRLFGVGRKKEAEEKMSQSTGALSGPPQPPVISTHPYPRPSSANHYRSPSPHPSSPATSLIFERDVQESVLPPQSSPAIPAHIQTEHHIPPVLEASSYAITDDHLDPDNVAIVTHAAHQPASATVTGTGTGTGTGTSTGSAISDAGGQAWSDDLAVHPEKDDAASNYGVLDAADVRRLSFISFADVVQSEHAEHVASHDPLHLPSSLPFSPIHFSAANRSPSPIRSPVSSHGPGTTPPTSVPASLHGLDASPGRLARGPGLGSPQSSGSPPPLGGELTIETMRQALRKTASSDLSGLISQPLSAVSADDTRVDHHWR